MRLEVSDDVRFMTGARRRSREVTYDILVDQVLRLVNQVGTPLIMADEHTSLISNRSSNRQRRSSCKMYRPSCVRSKGAVLTLILCFFNNIVTAIVVKIPILLLLLNDIQHLSPHRIAPVFGIFAVVCLSYPLLGLLGEKWIRYKVISIGYVVLTVSFIVVLVSYAVLVIKTFFSQDKSFSTSIQYTLIVVTLVVASMFSFPSVCIFQANIIQFGTDQLQFAPTEELSSFIHWLCWVYALPNSFVPVYTSSDHDILNMKFGSTLVVITGLMSAIAGVIFLYCFKRYLVIEPASHNNPIKIIWRVMKYVWKHKQPVRRSAFTYGEPPPSRLDLGKERYGGPFTTEQVEDVKTFWYILLILIVTFAFPFQESNIQLPFFPFNSKSFIKSRFLNNPAIIPYGIVVIVIPIHQLLIVPYFPHYIPSMLKRIWIGLVLVLVQLVVMTVNVSTDVSSELMPSSNQTELSTITHDVLIVSQFIEGISIMLLFTGSLEFFLAQAPRIMQGLIIGLWLMQNYFFVFSNVLISSYIGNRHLYIYYAAITILALISVIIYTITAYKYKYRQRNELSDVNDRLIITQYIEKQLEQEEQLQRDKDEIYYNVKSMVVN